MVGKRERILVADDHRDNVRFIIDAILNPRGFQVLEAYDGVEALRKASQEKPDLILLDIQMPKMTGLEVLQALYDQGIRIPVVLMTVHGSEEIAVLAFRLGARDYVIKPFTVDEMVRAIENALMESRLRRERDALTARLVQANQLLEGRLREMRTLYAIGQSVTSVLDLNELLNRVLDAALYLSPAQRVSIQLLETATTLRTAAERCRDAKRHEPMPSIAHTEKALEALQHHATLTASLSRRGGLCSFIPLEVRGNPIGVLAAQWPAGNQAPSAHHIQLLESLASYAAIAIQNARGFQQLEMTKERIRDGFQMYVSPAVVERILSDPAALSLGGVRQEISVMFADLCGFTALSERIPPEELVEVLNQYLSIMAETILSREGTIDKFLGDGVMAFFNAPLKQPDHVLRAAEAALDLKDAILRFHRRLTPDLRLDIRIGINTGEAIVGNIGTSRALSYTAIGDSVNLATRLQEQAEPGQILISEYALQRISDRVEVRPLGVMSVKGRQREERVFELLRLRT